MLVSENVLLRPYNTFGINAQARYFSPFADLEQLQTLLRRRCCRIPAGSLLPA